MTGVGVPNADFYTKYLEVPSVAKAGTWDISLAGWGPDWYGDAAQSYFAPLFYGNDGGTGSAYPPNGSDFGFYNSSPRQRADRARPALRPTRRSRRPCGPRPTQQVMKDAAIFPITANNQATYHASHTHNTVFIAALQADRPDQRLAEHQLSRVPSRSVLWRGDTAPPQRRWAYCGSVDLAGSWCTGAARGQGSIGHVRHPGRR